MSDWKKRAEPVSDWRSRAEPEGGAEGGSGGDESKPLEDVEKHPMGSLGDAAKAWANSAALGGGPQIAGAMGAVANAATNPGGSDVDAYASVRDDAARDIAKSNDTWAGKIGNALGIFSTPIPVKSLGPGAGIGAKAIQGAKVGAPIGALSAAFNSKADLTKADADSLREFLKDLGGGALGGGVTGGVVGGALGAAEPPLRSTARKLPMDMLGVGESARRSMQRQGIYDEAGDELLKLIRPGRSGMRRGSLAEDALNELSKRGESQGALEAAIDAKAPGGVTSTDRLADAMREKADPRRVGSLQDKQTAARMDREAASAMENHGELLPEVGAPISLSEAEQFKQRFGPAVAKQLRHAGEPAAKTDALADVYRAIKDANEKAAADVSPELAAKWKQAKRSYGTLAAPLEGAGVERSGMRSSDFDLGTLLNEPAPPGLMSKMANSVPLAGPLAAKALDMVGQAYGRGTAAKFAEFLANQAAKNSGGNVGGRAGASIPWSSFLDEEQQ